MSGNNQPKHIQMENVCVCVRRTLYAYVQLKRKIKHFANDCKNGSMAFVCI